ncbi:hypothetical protein SAMN05518672_102373 [Chitinophaga sp. CF118]|uniref:SMI1/KNR4 family protein n=1 Tax=Chitinophaga sp. CF118 TaxID=1884367 RepID=UPI0008EEF770|nr:SMI1/KNR4 family protein [Chitinophaga sp. CF118]SFD54553.1 hypothetical protein SAMN05518672_102373 [Chitinophaga sp. CF118]
MDKQGLDYIKKHSAELQILTVDDLPDPTVLPASWLDLLSVKGEERINKTLELWKPFSKELGNVLMYLHENLRSVELIHQVHGYSLLYGIQKETRILYYEGQNPLSKKVPDNISKYWKHLPEKLSDFYELHNGWFYFASRSMGLASVERWSFLGDDEWGILDELGELDFNLDDMLAIYPNGMGDYVCVNVTKERGESMLWFHNKAPMRNIDFWRIIDVWTHIGITG